MLSLLVSLGDTIKGTQGNIFIKYKLTRGTIGFGKADIRSASQLCV